MFLNLKKFIHLHYLFLLVIFSEKGKKAWNLLLKAPEYKHDDWKSGNSMRAVRILALRDLEHTSLQHVPFLYEWVLRENKQVVIERIKELLPKEIEEARSGRCSGHGRGYHYLLLLSYTPRMLWREFGLHSFFDQITDDQIKALKNGIEMRHSIGGSFYSSVIEKISSREDLHL